MAAISTSNRIITIVIMLGIPTAGIRAQCLRSSDRVPWIGSCQLQCRLDGNCPNTWGGSSETLTSDFGTARLDRMIFTTLLS